MTHNWFEIDNAGWKRMNAGRPPYELVKELIQNVLDEEFGIANINYSYSGGIFSLSIEDDVLGGIQDSNLITTVFMTGKEDSHLKRGRKGRGLKEFLAVCDSAIVETVGKTIEFKNDGTRDDYTNNRTCGTKISCKITAEGWTRKAVNQINKFLDKIILYSDGKLNINGKELSKRNIFHSIAGVYLDTQIVVNGVQREKRESTGINIYLRKDKEGWLYEMGIPVTKTDIPYDVDIKQRIPLNDNRNDVDYEYIQDVKSFVVKALLSSLTKDDMLGWAAEGFKRVWFFTAEEQKIIAEKMVGNAIIFESTVIKSNRNMDDKARQKGYVLFDVSSMNYYLKNIVQAVIKTSDTLINEIESNCKPVDVEPTEDEKTFCETHQKLVKSAIGLDIIVKIVEKPHDLVSGKMTEAFYQQGNVSILSYNRLAISEKVFKKPLGVKALNILFHELGHEKASEHDDFKYLNAVTYYAAKITVYLIKGNTEVKEVKEKREKKQGGVTLKDSIKKILEVQGFNYLSLTEIYGSMNATTTNEKAGIRSILNRECASDNGLFERSSLGGEYRLKAI